MLGWLGVDLLCDFHSQTFKRHLENTSISSLSIILIHIEIEIAPKVHFHLVPRGTLIGERLFFILLLLAIAVA